MALGAGYFVRTSGGNSDLASWQTFGGLLSSLLSVGCYVTSPASTLGKISYAGVVLLTMGVALKTLHWTGANGLLVAGLTLMIVPFGIEFFRGKRKTTRKEQSEEAGAKMMTRLL